MVSRFIPSLVGASHDKRTSVASSKSGISLASSATAVNEAVPVAAYTTTTAIRWIADINYHVDRPKVDSIMHAFAAWLFEAAIIDVPSASASLLSGL